MAEFALPTLIKQSSDASLTHVQKISVDEIASGLWLHDVNSGNSDSYK